MPSRFVHQVDDPRLQARAPLPASRPASQPVPGWPSPLAGGAGGFTSGRCGGGHAGCGCRHFRRARYLWPRKPYCNSCWCSGLGAAARPSSGLLAAAELLLAAEIQQHAVRAARSGAGGIVKRAGCLSHLACQGCTGALPAHLPASVVPPPLPGLCAVLLHQLAVACVGMTQGVWSSTLAVSTHTPHLPLTRRLGRR